MRKEGCKVTEIEHPPSKLAEKFVKQIRFVDGMLGCWWWTGKTDKDGYGQIFHRGKYERAHVVSYLRLKGSYPPGQQIDHLCHNRLCVNPGHLRATSKPGSCHRRECRVAMTGAERQRKHRAKRQKKESDRLLIVMKIAEHGFKPHDVGFTIPKVSARINAPGEPEYEPVEA